MSLITEKKNLHPLSNLLLPFKAVKVFKEAFSLQQETIKQFYSLSKQISGNECKTTTPSGMLTLERNILSTLFLGITASLVKTKKNMPLYAMTNQCMRAWVTACDNILDDEEKEIFEFSNINSGKKIESVLTLMIAERVLTTFIGKRYQDIELNATVAQISLQSLLSSALQEGEEEKELYEILSPEKILSDIHQRKTADLFSAPLALPIHLESPNQDTINNAKGALENFAIGCQIIDDIKDAQIDCQMQRHNLLISMLFYDKEPKDIENLRNENTENWVVWQRFPETFNDAGKLALSCFEKSFTHMKSLDIVFSNEHKSSIIKLVCKLLKIPSFI